MVKEQIRFIDIVNDVSEVIICGLDENQMQSSYLLINGVIHYCVMKVPNFDNDDHTHNNSVENLRYFLDNRIDEYFNIYDIEYLSRHNQFRMSGVEKMREFQDKFSREHKISQLLK